jgi:predicted metalloenzyme YecM
MGLTWLLYKHWPVGHWSQNNLDILRLRIPAHQGYFNIWKHISHTRPLDVKTKLSRTIRRLSEYCLDDAVICIAFFSIHERGFLITLTAYLFNSEKFSSRYIWRFYLHLCRW